LLLALCKSRVTARRGYMTARPTVESMIDGSRQWQKKKGIINIRTCKRFHVYGMCNGRLNVLRRTWTKLTMAYFNVIIMHLTRDTR